MKKEYSSPQIDITTFMSDSNVSLNVSANQTAFTVTSGKKIGAKSVIDF